LLYINSGDATDDDGGDATDDGDDATDDGGNATDDDGGDATDDGGDATDDGSDATDGGGDATDDGGDSIGRLCEWFVLPFSNVCCFFAPSARVLLQLAQCTFIFCLPHGIGFPTSTILGCPWSDVSALMVVPGALWHPS
jgi:hypothetical protein